jgi:hypothetical protein
MPSANFIRLRRKQGCDSAEDIGRVGKTPIITSLPKQLRFDAAHYSNQRGCKNLSRACNSPRKLNQARNAMRMRKEVGRQHCEASSLLADVE